MEEVCVCEGKKEDVCIRGGGRECVRAECKHV